jgi:hypothetical protein
VQITAASRYILIVVTILSLFALSATDKEEEFTRFHGEYLGQTPVGYQPEPFVPELFSVWGDYGFHVSSCVRFSPDANELLFSNQSQPAAVSKSGTLWQMFRKNDLWTEPRVAFFPGDYSEDRAFYSQSGETLYYSTTRPVTEKGPPKDFDIWFVARHVSNRSRPQRLGYPVNTIYNDYAGAVTANGTIYFSSDRPSGKGGVDIYYAQLIDGGYGPLTNLGEGTNTDADEYVVCVDDDETYMILHRTGVRAGAENGLYISYKKKHHGWTIAKSMGDHLKVLNATDASLSPDGNYLFILSEGNGVYWLKAGIVDYLRDEDLQISRILINAVLDDGMDAAFFTYETLKQRHAIYIDINEYMLNQRGHQLLDAEQRTEAIALFQIVVELFPDSWNAYDSLGEAYFASGMTDLAARCYERSLGLNPRNENAVRMLEYISKVLHH